MKRASTLTRRTPLPRGDSRLKRTPLARGDAELETRKPLKNRTPLRQVNPQRKAKRDELRFGPGGPSGDYAVIIRALPCSTCGKGRRVSLPSWEDVERLRYSAQSECSHVEQGRLAPWWTMVPQCTACHTAGPHAVHGLGASGWGSCRGLALLFAAALAWAAVDAGRIPPDRLPECERPAVPKGVTVTAVVWFGAALRGAWPTRHETEVEG